MLTAWIAKINDLFEWHDTKEQLLKCTCTFSKIYRSFQFRSKKKTAIFQMVLICKTNDSGKLYPFILKGQRHQGESSLIKQPIKDDLKYIDITVF